MCARGSGANSARADSALTQAKLGEDSSKLGESTNVPTEKKSDKGDGFELTHEMDAMISKLTGQSSLTNRSEDVMYTL